MPSSRTKGRALERLVAELERSLSGREDLVVESPKWLKDKVTGRLREHDVVLTLKEGHHELLISIECRDRKRKVGSGQVEAFKTKCEHSEVARGIIVSARGFTEPAKNKAAFCGIRCLGLEEVGGVDWLAMTGMRVFSRKLEHLDIVFVVPSLKGKKLAGFELVNSAGEVVSNKHVAFVVQSHLPLREPSLGSCRVPFVLDVGDLWVRTPGGESTYLVSRLKGTAHFVYSTTRVPFRVLRYSEDATQEHLTDVAVASIDEEHIKGEFVIIYHPEKGGEVLFMPRRESGS